MHFQDIAIRSLRRRRGCTVLLMISLSVAVAAIVGISSVSSALRMSVESKLREFGANRVVMPKTLPSAGHGDESISQTA